MGMRKFWSMALPFGKVACVVNYNIYNKELLGIVTVLKE